MGKTTLNFKEAMEALRDGKKVKLPEWAGHWFVSEGQEYVHVLTAQGDVLHTPYLDDYTKRTDFEVTDGSRDFGGAIKALKAGKMVARKGWNGKGMFLFIRPADVLTTDFIPKIKSLPEAVKNYLCGLKYRTEDNEPSELPVKIEFSSYICMKAADNSIVNGWLASQTDMLAEDWVIFE